MLAEYSDLAGWREKINGVSRKKALVPYNDKLPHTMVWHFNAFSGTQLIFSQAGTSAAFLWVP
ncbi:MAG: hypothetical protein IKI25_03090, partial [Bacteroidales bacterium]|nr:hypothetical protein [Bacteroidales bacterium]